MVHLSYQVVDPFFVGDLDIQVIKSQDLTGRSLHCLEKGVFEHSQK
jgi:hypothetical protein